MASSTQRICIIRNASAILCFTSAMLAFGCNRSNPYLATQPGTYSAYGQSASPNALNGALWQNPVANSAATNTANQVSMAAQAQVQELERRARLLDENNRQLTAQIAQVQQQSDLHRERAELLQGQLQEASRQIELARVTNLQTQQEVFAARSEATGLQASIRRNGGATLVANSSLQKLADSISASGFPATVDGRVIRVAVPSDQLFQPNTAQMLPAANGIVDRIANAVVVAAPRNRIGIEAHTDGAPVANNAATSNQQLASLQAVAIYEQIQRAGHAQVNQMFTLAHGANHPIADNATPAGRAQNRRIEFVVYPDTF